MEFKTVEQVLAAWDSSRVSQVSLPLGPVAAMRASGETVSLPQQMEVPLVERSRVLAEPVYITSDSVRERAALMESAVVDMATRYTPKQVVFVLVQERAGLTPLMSRLPHVAAWFDATREGGSTNAESYIDRVISGREELLRSEGYVSIAQRNEVLESRGERVSPAIVIVNDAAHTENNAEVARWVARGRSLGMYYLGAGSTGTQFDEDAVAVDRQESAARSWWYCLGGGCDDYVADPVEGDTETAVEAVISAYSQWTAEQAEQQAAQEQAAQEEQQAAQEQAAQEEQQAAQEQAAQEERQAQAQAQEEQPAPEKSEAPAETAPETGQEPAQAQELAQAAQTTPAQAEQTTPAQEPAQAEPEKSEAPAETAPATGQEPATAPAGESAVNDGDVTDTAAAPAPSTPSQTPPEKSAATAETAPAQPEQQSE